MTTTLDDSKVAQSYQPVKRDTHVPVIHHKPRPTNTSIKQGNLSSSANRTYYSSGELYGVSTSRRLLTPGLLNRRWDRIRDCLSYNLGLTTAQREVVFRLLRLWAYYGSVYPTAAQIAEDPGCSRATFWRTIRKLEERGLVMVVNRYIHRPEAQISNLYRLDKLVMVIARYLAGHCAQVWPDWFNRYLRLPVLVFHNWITGSRYSLTLSGVPPPASSGL